MLVTLTMKNQPDPIRESVTPEVCEQMKAAFGSGEIRRYPVQPTGFIDIDWSTVSAIDCDEGQSAQPQLAFDARRYGRTHRR